MGAKKLFGTSGIRGIVDQDLSPDFCRRVALAIGTTLPQSSTVCIATDTRISRHVIKEAITTGLLSCCVNVVDLGILPTPALALLTRELGFAAGIMVTASHNPPEFNGIKLFTDNSLGYSQAQEEEIERIYFEQRFRQGEKGSLKQAQDMKQKYLAFIKGKLSPPGFNHHLKVVVDPGNGAASRFASDILVQMGLDVIPVNNEPDGLFPGRSPEPKEDTLRGTVDFLRQHNADLAVCFDGDADRVVFCDKEGFLGFNEPIAFISTLAVKKTGKKKVATTVETGTLLDLAVKDLGVEVVRGRVGDVAVAHLVQQLDAALGVEQVGVYIMPEVGHYPDSIFASLFLLSQLGDAGEIRQFFQGIPRLFFEKAKVSCPDELKESVMARAKEKANLFASDEMNTVDGLRLKFADSWMLIRASGTEPVIRIISESMSQKQTDELISKGKKLIQSLVEADK
ncbi:MAG: phosphoglucosamine mutase [Dehalococcoidia bacterium]|nr:phosphoglucosamine mutase [Dehalococcoidia bacterium]MDH4291567.1 phosphoglucosamine mutase [Dehalococcoidia bacterium]